MSAFATNSYTVCGLHCVKLLSEIKTNCSGVSVGLHKTNGYLTTFWEWEIGCWNSEKGGRDETVIRILDLGSGLRLLIGLIANKFLFVEVLDIHEDVLRQTHTNRTFHRRSDCNDH